MTDTAFGRDGDLALCVYLEPLLEARRVLVLGSLDKETERKLSRLAEDVELLEEDALDGELDLPFAGGAFDAVWLVDSSLLRPTPDALTELKRVLARDGALIVSSLIEPDPARRRPGPAEAGLSRALWPEFLDLRLFRQSSVVGQALQEIEATAGRIVVDTSLVADMEPNPERIVAIASDVQLRLDSALWVQELPSSRGQVHEDEKLRERLQEATERAHTLSLTLDAAEADLEDAFSRARAFDAQIAEKDIAGAHEREHRIRAERALEHQKAEIMASKKLVAAAEAARDTARTELEGVSAECAELEARLVERGTHIQALELDQKRSETAARDLIEELRRIEHERTSSAEHDGKMAELEAHAARAVARALEAEVAREAALMRVDELRARVVQLESRPAPLPVPTVDPELEGTLFGLRMRVRELELEQSRQEAAARRPVARDPSADVARGQISGLTLRLEEAERALSSARAPKAAEQSSVYEDRIRALERELEEAERALSSARAANAAEQSTVYEDRIRALERELEEADRFGETHADDVDRIESLEIELTRAHRRYDDLEDEMRVTQDDLRAARTEVEHLALETSARVELAQRRENEARTERDHARAALEEARSILAQLTAKAPIDATDPNVS